MTASLEANQPVAWWRRVSLAFALFFRVLFDGRLAARLSSLLGSQEQVPSAPPLEGAARPVVSSTPGPAEGPAQGAGPRPSAGASADALQRSREQGATLLLSLFQSEGRLVDFVQQPLTGFDDAEVGAVARVVHEGCRRVVQAQIGLQVVLDQPEGEAVLLPEGYDAAAIKLTGDVRGEGSFQGVLRHRGWRATEVHLPSVAESHRSDVICPAEVEL